MEQFQQNLGITVGLTETLYPLSAIELADENLLQSIKGPLFSCIKYNFSQSLIKHLKNTKLYSIELLRTEMTLDPLN